MKFGDDLDLKIKDYIGRMGPGVTVLLSIIYKSELHEGMYWYTNDHAVLELPTVIKNDIADIDIEDYEYYNDIMSYLKENCAKYEDISPRLDDIA